MGGPLTFMITLRELASQFIEWVDNSHSLERKTRAYYVHGWKLLAGSAIADRKLDRIKNCDCDCIQFPGGPANANTALRTLRRMLAYAKELEILPQVPEIALRKEWPRSVAMTRLQASRIAECMSPGDPRDAFHIIRATGMRPAECFSMRWEYVNWETQIYQNPKGKRKSARRAIPLLAPAGDILRGRYCAQGSPAGGYVFPSTSSLGHILSIHKVFTKARNLAGYPPQMVLYTARHGAATDLASVLTLKETMDILGHDDARTAMRYQHCHTADIQRKLEKIQ